VQISVCASARVFVGLCAFCELVDLRDSVCDCVVFSFVCVCFIVIVCALVDLLRVCECVSAYATVVLKLHRKH